MSGDTGERVHETVDAVYRSDSRRVFAALIRPLGDCDLTRQEPERRFLARRLAELPD